MPKKNKKISLISAAPKPKSKRQWWLITLIAAFFIIVLAGGGVKLALAGKIYPGIKIGSLAVGLKKPDEALRLLQGQTDAFLQKGITVASAKRTVIIHPVVISTTDPDLSREILSFDNEAMIQRAWQVGRNRNFLTNLKEKFIALIFKKQLPIIFNLDEAEFKKILKNNFADLENPAKNAELFFDENNEPKTTEETGGYAFDYDTALAEIGLNTARLKNKPVILEQKISLPQIKQGWTGPAIKEVPEILKLAPINLVYKNKKWPIDRQPLQNWLKFELTNRAENYNQQESFVTLALKPEEVTSFLEKLVPEINVEPLDAKFKIANGRVAEFQASRDGEEVDLEKTYQQLNQQIIKDKKNETAITVKITLAKITTGDVNDLGIKELVGEGRSNFSGSPKNRRHNIAVGAKTLNGLLIKPGEEFSLVKTLGNTDAKAGYLPELVIKGNETTPEYGGGLCQIGTTTFRVALNAGLPITERKNHSYRVSYYEPAGTDATIYNPQPDLKFINDTPANLLLQTRIEGDELIFELYGTADGRQVEQTQPRIFNFVKPAESKTIETLDLKPGQKKCTERAHTGADTEFTRKIIYANGETKEEVWRSHYRPWQEVCLLGVEKLSEQPPTPNPTENEQQKNDLSNTAAQ